MSGFAAVQLDELRTICDVHRTLAYHLKDHPDPKVLALVREGFDMGKAIDRRLRWFKFKRRCPREQWRQEQDELRLEVRAALTGAEHGG